MRWGGGDEDAVVLERGCYALGGDVPHHEGHDGALGDARPAEVRDDDAGTQRREGLHDAVRVWVYVYVYDCVCVCVCVVVGRRCCGGMELSTRWYLAQQPRQCLHPVPDHGQADMQSIVNGHAQRNL